jgi:Fur family ferric uptake transcriptional regulator
MELQTPRTPGSDLPVSNHQEKLVRASNRAEKVPNKKIIRDMGLKVTGQRELILEVVRKGPSHFTAQEVFERVIDLNPAIGFATVYRFLRMLTENSYVTEVRMGGMPARYEWAAKRHHDHLTCVNCNEIVEFENTEIERLQEKVAKEFGFMLTHHLLELYGVCPECRGRESTRAAKKG